MTFVNILVLWDKPFCGEEGNISFELIFQPSGRLYWMWPWSLLGHCLQVIPDCYDRCKRIFSFACVSSCYCSIFVFKRIYLSTYIIFAHQYRYILPVANGRGSHGSLSIWYDLPYARVKERKEIGWSKLKSLNICHWSFFACRHS